MLALIEIALGEYGNIEVAGAENNPEVMKYFHETGREWVDGDYVPWCDAFVDWVVMKAGLEPTPKLLAREWLERGKPVIYPRVGDLVILWRKAKDSPYGHVGFFVRETDDVVWILGGNQSDMVRISAYPKERLLGYRRL